MKYLGTKNNDESLVDKKYVDERLISSSNKEAFLEWGGKNLVNAVSPIDSACLDEHSANRLIGFKGVTYHDTLEFAQTDRQKHTPSVNTHELLTGAHSIPFGWRTAGTPVNTDKLYVKLNFTKGVGQDPRLYCESKKLLINFSTSGATGCKVTIYTRTMKTWRSGGGYTQFGVFDVNGWSGWNSIPLELTIGCYGSQQETSDSIESIILEFSHQQAGGSPAELRGLRLIAPTLYYAESLTAYNGLPYKVDKDGNMIAHNGIFANSVSMGNITLSPTSGGFSVLEGGVKKFDVTGSQGTPQSTFDVNNIYKNGNIVVGKSSSKKSRDYLWYFNEHGRVIYFKVPPSDLVPTFNVDGVSKNATMKDKTYKVSPSNNKPFVYRITKVEDGVVYVETKTLKRTVYKTTCEGVFIDNRDYKGRIFCNRIQQREKFHDDTILQRAVNKEDLLRAINGENYLYRPFIKIKRNICPVISDGNMRKKHHVFVNLCRSIHKCRSIKGFRKSIHKHAIELKVYAAAKKRWRSSVPMHIRMSAYRWYE